MKFRSIIPNIFSTCLVVLAFAWTGCASTLESASQTMGSMNRSLACAGNNDSFKCADPIRLGNEYQERIYNPEKELDSRDAEGDLYTFEVDQDGVIEVAVDPVPAEVALNSQIFNSQQDPMLTWPKRSGARGKSIFYEVLVERGKYYVSVVGSRGHESRDSYTLKVTMDDDDRYEVNNTFAQAKAVSVGEVVNAKIRPAGDVDYYEFEVARAGVIEAAIESVPPNLGLKMASYNRRQEAVGRTTRGGKGKNLYHSFKVQPGTYYIGVASSWRGQASDRIYQLRLNMKEGM